MSATAPAKPFAQYLFREYVFPGGVRKCAVALKRRWAGGWRTTQVSAHLNDEANAGLWADIHARDQQALYDYVVYQKGRTSYLLKDDRVTYGDRSQVESYLHEQMASALELSASPEAAVLEFGCAAGRNLFWLKTRYPNLSLHGVDVSAEGLRAGEAMARQFGLDVSFTVLRDHCLPFPDGAFEMAFTKHCLEQCPSTYPAIIQELWRVTKKRLVFMEPMPELYPWSVRGVGGRLHNFYCDYARGIFSHLRQVGGIRQAERLRWASNPLNETCLIVMEKPAR